MEGSESSITSGYQWKEPSFTSSKGMDKALRILRDSFMGRIPEDSRTTVVSLAWQELWSKAAKYLNKDELKLLGEAFVYAANKHRDQKRVTGEPYVVHLLSVAGILADIDIDIETLVAALLHDVLEDTDTSFEEIKEKFGTNVPSSSMALQNLEISILRPSRTTRLKIAKDVSGHGQGHKGRVDKVGRSAS